MGKVKMETPDIQDIVLDSEGRDPKAVTFAKVADSKRVGSTENDIGIDLSGADEESIFGGLTDEPGLDDWVVARFDGTPGTSKGAHKQSVNGVKAIFPLGQHRLVKFYFVKGARRSGNADFAENPGKKNMKFIVNRPVFFVQKVPTEHQADILAYVAMVKEKRGVQLLFAADQL